MTNLRQRLDEALLRFHGSFEEPSWSGLEPATERMQRRIREAGLLDDGRLQDVTDLNDDRGVWLGSATEGSPLGTIRFSAIGPFFCLIRAGKLLEAPDLAPEAADLLERLRDALDRPEFLPASILGKRSPLRDDRGEPLSYFAALFHENDIYDDPAEFPAAGG